MKGTVAREMKKRARKFYRFEDAEAWESAWYLDPTAEERIGIARALKKRVWGEKVPDIREATRRQGK